jgi:hypothetical protein
MDEVGPNRQPKGRPKLRVTIFGLVWVWVDHLLSGLCATLLAFYWCKWILFSSSRLLKQYRHGSLKFTDLTLTSYWLNPYPYDPNGYALPRPPRWRKSHRDFGIASWGILILGSNCFFHVERMRHVINGYNFLVGLSILFHYVVVYISQHWRAVFLPISIRSIRRFITRLPFLLYSTNGSTRTIIHL